MSKFAKLFEVEDNQVLVTIQYGDEPRLDHLNISTVINGLEMSLNVGFASPPIFNNPRPMIEDVLKSYTKTKAEYHYRWFKSLLDPTEEE